MTDGQSGDGYTPSRPHHVSTFPLKAGGELVVVIEKAGEPVKLILPTGELVLGRGLAIAIGRAIAAAGWAAEKSARRDVIP